ncbi:exodeoxyribonuclease VII large subunit [Luteolibacter sp. Populi]|uniref:exodeoxyribonuclease VII large subunit n=1 Tax=Luteolibacter sp. Populi TaxID=3230487 RepID=UPI0034660052
MDDLFAPKPAPAPKALSVTQLVRRMKNLLEVELGEVWVEGEVSNLKKQASGHWYFSLKDEGAQIQCAIFGARKKAGSEALEDGAKVRVFAEPSVYEARGQLQIIVQRVERAGLGELQARFEALKRKLQGEGLFDPERKQPIPFFPRTVGIVTSDTGAAIRDIQNILERRAPWVQPVLYPVRVQGKGAEVEIAKAIQRMGNPERFGLPRCEVLIVGRGGGSIEDLWNFNEEIVARAIAACPIPIISAVGHEIDFTIADFAADLRAPTPSAAAELAVPDGAELKAKLAMLKRRLARRTAERIERLGQNLDSLRRGVLSRGGERLLREPTMRVDSARAKLNSAVLANFKDREQSLKELSRTLAAHHPARQVELRLEHLARTRERLERAARRRFDSLDDRLSRLRSLLRTLGPESAFERGFSIAMDSYGRIIRSKADVSPGEEIRTKVRDGEIRSTTL